MQYQGGKSVIATDIANIISGNGGGENISNNEISRWQIKNSKRNSIEIGDGGGQNYYLIRWFRYFVELVI